MTEPFNFSNIEDFLDCYNQPKFMNKNPVDYWKNDECKYFLEQAVKLLEKVVEKNKLLSSFEDNESMKILSVEEVCGMIGANAKDLIHCSGKDIVRMARLDGVELKYLGDSLWEFVEAAKV